MTKNWQRFIPVIVGALVVLIVTLILVLFVRKMLNSKPSGPTRAVEQKITMIRPTPPPETPPPPPPPPEKIEEPMQQPDPQQAPDQAEASPAEQLGLDADAAAGGDGFGLAARKGGRDLVGTGTAPFKWYTNLIVNRLQDCLSSDSRIRKGSYKANVKVRISAEGRIEIVELFGTTGNTEKDTAIRGLKACSVGEGRPLEMPQLATLQIVSRG